jgi:Polysaccharide pyruvyl transferase
MKKALLKYDFTNEGLNIGDYIQSLAAKQFLNDSNPILISRESLHEYDGEEVKLIMNGWFLLKGENFPPSNKIKPLLISHHINTSVHSHFKRKEVIDFYKKNEPVGCRDHFTLKFLEGLGIKCHYTACLTLTLSNKYKSKEKNDTVYFVDPRYNKTRGFFGQIFRLYLLTSKFNTIRNIRSRFIRSNKKKSWKKTIDFYKSFSQIFEDDVLANAVYIKHYMPTAIFKNDAEIFAYGEELLKKYASAKYVVTSRIHCALPSLSLETTVLYIDIPNDNIISSCRLDGIKELFHIINTNGIKLSCNLLKPGEKFNSKSTFINKQDFLILKYNIEKMALDFMKE